MGYTQKRHLVPSLVFLSFVHVACGNEEFGQQELASSSTPYTYLSVASCAEKGAGQVEVAFTPGVTNLWQDFCSGDSAYQFSCRTSDMLAYRHPSCEHGCDKGKCLPPLYSVADFGAKGDGVSDDGPAFQAALDAADGGGRVYIPTGSYLIRQTLLLGDHTEVYGDGPSSVLRRTKDKTLVNVLHNYISRGPEAGSCSQPTGYHGRILFMNRKYSCGTVGITLHDFQIDGGLVTDTPDAVTIALSGTKDTHIHHLTLTDLPQDGIFMRNGGQNTLIENNVFDGYNMRWFNGGGVNVEMWSNANYPTTADSPVIVRNNLFIGRGPAVCSNSKLMTCIRDSDCGSNGKCITEAIAVHAGIPNATIPGSVPYMVVENNEIRLSNRNYAVVCKHCKNSRITGNHISALPAVAPHSDDAASGRYSGIHVLGGDHVLVQNNTLLSNQLKNDERGILVDSGTHVFVMNNYLEDRITRYALDTVAVRTTTSFRLYKNQVVNCGGGNGISIGGGCADFIPETGYGSVLYNEVSTPTLVAPKFPLLIRKTPSIYLKGNTTSPSPNAKTEC